MAQNVINEKKREVPTFEDFLESDPIRDFDIETEVKIKE
jgi:hypothetical protein